MLHRQKVRAHVKNQSELEITVTRMAVGISASLKKTKRGDGRETE